MLPRTCTVALSTLLASHTFAQDAANYPSKPARMIVPLAAGGPTDIFARNFAAFFDRKFGQPMIVENRVGASGMIATEAVIKSDPDGYTLLTWSNGAVYESLVNKEARVNTRTGLQGVGVYAGTGLFLAVAANLPSRNLREFVDWIKANPGKANYGAPGRPNAEMLEFRHRLGLDFVVVPYKGGPAALQALIAGEVTMYNPSAGEAIPNHQAGKIRALAYGDRTRHPNAPDIPTFMESGVGLDDYTFRVWLGAYAPAAVPIAIVRKLNAAIVEHGRTPEATDLYTKIGWMAMPISVEEVRSDLDSFYKRIAALHGSGVQLR